MEHSCRSPIRPRAFAYLIPALQPGLECPLVLAGAGPNSKCVSQAFRVFEREQAASGRCSLRIDGARLDEIPDGLATFFAADAHRFKDPEIRDDFHGSDVH